MKMSYFALVGLALSAPASAQKHRVFVGCTNKDSESVGQRMCQELRDAITRSPRYTLIPTDDETFHLSVHITTLDPDDNGRSSVAAVTFTFQAAGKNQPDIFITQYIHSFGAQRAVEVGDDVLAELDSEVTTLDSGSK